MRRFAALCALVACAAAARAPGAESQDPASIIASVEQQAEKESDLHRVHACYYVIVDGDTLNGVADYFGCPLSLLQSYNDWVGAVSKFEVGRKLHIPAVRSGREGRCVEEKRATEADARHQTLVKQMRESGSETVGADVRRAFSLRERIHRELAKHNVELRKAAHKHCADCDDARRTEVRELEDMKRNSEAREAGNKREKELAKAHAEKAATEEGAAAIATSLALPACVYTARGEDSYGSISVMFGTPLALLRETNDLTKDASNWIDRPVIGRVLRIPRPAIKARTMCDAEVDVCPYLVRRGDSLGSIADKFGSSRAHIAIVNKLPSTDFGYWPKLDATLLIPKPSDAGAELCSEAPKKMVVGVPVVRDVANVEKTHEEAVVDNAARAEDAEEDADVAADKADSAKAKAEGLMQQASALREEVSAKTEDRKAASEEVLAARTAYKASLKSQDKTVQTVAMRRLDKAETAQREATEALDKAKTAAADASEKAQIATTVWQKRTGEAESEAAMSEAHSAQDEAEDAQDEGEPNAGKADLDYSDHSKDPETVEDAAEAQLQESTEVQLAMAKKSAARNAKAAQAAAEGEAEAKEHAAKVQLEAQATETEAALLEVLEAERPRLELADDEALDAHLAGIAMQRAPPQKKADIEEVAPELEYVSPEEAEAAEEALAQQEAREAAATGGATGLASITSATGMAAAEEVAAAAAQVASTLEAHQEKAKQERAVAAADEETAEAQRAAVAATEQAMTLKRQLAAAKEAEAAAKEAQRVGATGGMTGLEGGEGTAQGLSEGEGSNRAGIPAGPVSATEAELRAELDAERRRRVRVEGKLVTLTHELQDAHARSAAAAERAEALRQARAALERRLRVADETQARAEEQVRRAASAAEMVRADVDGAADLAAEHQEVARRSASGLGMTGMSGSVSSEDEAELDPCSRAAQAQAEAHEQSLRMKMAKATVARRRARLDELQESIEARDAAVEEVQAALETASRELRREVAQREKEATAFTESFHEHMKVADGARKMRSSLVHSRVGLLNGELNAYGGPVAEEAERAKIEVDAVEAVKKGVRSGALPASWMTADGELTEIARKQVDAVVNTPPAIVDGQRVLGYTREGKPLLDDGSVTARAEAEVLDPVKQVAAILARRRRSASHASRSAAMLEVSSNNFSKSPAQRSSVRRLREYLRRLTEAAHLSLGTLEAHEKDAHAFFRTLHTEVEPRLDALHAEHRRLVRERNHMQAERIAVQEDMQHQVVAMEDAQREYNGAAESVMASLERCASSAHSLHEIRH